MKKDGLSYSRLNDPSFPFDLSGRGNIMMEYECKGCHKKVKCDPREVPDRCLNCNSEFPFFRVGREKVAT